MHSISGFFSFAKRTSALVLILVLAATSATAENLEHVQVLQGAEHRVFESETIGRPFHIYTLLPAGYSDEPNDKYRTIYLLDGGLHLALLGAYHRYLHALGDTGPAIIVAISYGSDTFEGGNHRSIDFTAPSDERDYWGGAAKFQQFFADELIPWVESSYRADPSERVIFGQSLGGQFVLYTAQTRPDLFSGHIASNPALHRNLDFYLKQYPSKGSESKLFVGHATRDSDRFLIPRNEWIRHWQAKQERPWTLKVEPLIDHTHASAPPAAFRQGLAWFDMISE